MNYTYAINQFGGVTRSDGVNIPCDPANTDYAAYLASSVAATPYTPTPEQVKADAQATIDAQLAALDIKRIRPTAEGDTTYLATLNAQAVALRAQRAAL